MTIALLIIVIAAIIVITAIWKIHPLPVLLLGGLIFGVCSGKGMLDSVEMISAGFGNTMKSIGLVILAGTVIGAFMEKRGALKVMALKVIHLTGVKRTPLGMSIIGYLVSICIFCDSAFIILIGLWKKIGLISHLPLAVGACALSMGLLSSHCFIPPAAGPLAAMTLLKADLGYVLLFGSLSALASAGAGYVYATLAGKYEVLADELTLPQQEAVPADAEEPEAENVPGVAAAFLPIVLPLLLIGSASLVNVFKSSLPGTVVQCMRVAGNPFVALSTGALLAVFGIGSFRKAELAVEGLMGKAIVNGGNILMVTGAGGAFGEVLKRVDYKSMLPERISGMGLWALLVPLGFAALLKVAQGSSSLAILTAAGVTLPLLDVLQLTTPVLRALSCCAVCCGGMLVSHTNDSYFWIVTRFSGMSVAQGLKMQTLGSFVCGCAACCMLLIFGWIFG